ncbi:MAG: DUF6293 family protein [Nanoarchaeota archaeon]
MKNTIIAPVGDSMDSLYIGIKEFPTEKVILITPQERMHEAVKAKNELEKFKIPVQLKEIKGNLWEETFKAVAEITHAEKDSNILVNVATGTRESRCASTSAAFVNGLKAFAVDGNTVQLLPVMKFSYYKLLSDKKMDLLKIIYSQNCCASLEDLSRKSRMSLPLISYHVNGNLKSEGLKELGLIETKEVKGRVEVKLTSLGRLLLKGHV